MSDCLVRLADVSLGYGGEPVLENVDLDIARGRFLGVIGPNGSGKTTLLRGILGLLPLMAGRLEMPAGRVRFGYVRQRQPLDSIFPVTVEELVLMGRQGHLGPFRRPGADDRVAVEHALATVDALDLAPRLLRDLSGGQAQRILLARALASQPDVLVLDEPTNDLDLPSEESVLRLLERVCRERSLGVVLVSHLLNVALGVADTLVLVQGGATRVGPTAELATAAELSAFYGMPVEVARVAGRLTVVPATPRETATPPTPRETGTPPTPRETGTPSAPRETATPSAPRETGTP